MSEKFPSTREKICSAALKVFSQKGYSGATTSEIAREAGVAEGTIFRYFSTKKDLLLGSVDTMITGSLKGIIEKHKESPPHEFFEAVLRNRFEIVKENIDLVKVIAVESCFHPEVKEKFVSEIVLPAISLMRAYFNERRAKGDFRDIDPEFAVRVLVGMTAVFVVWRYVFEGEKYVSFSDEYLASAIVDVYLNGILRKEGEGGASS